MSEKEYKIFRDPIHGNIKILPFELKIIDLRIFQRLRYLKQTPSVGYVFHSANHTRFEHSIGALHIAEMYALNLNISDPRKEFLRLGALLHDIGHGIFSHLYDDVVYREIYKDEEHGHDIHKIKIIREYLPGVLVETYDGDELRESIASSGLNKCLSSNTKDSVKKIMHKVAEILKSEETVNYNIIHGPLGCDRMDFVKRDSYFAGTGHYAGFPLDRIIQFSSVQTKNNEDILCYSSKILDDIILFLINRFHMYKNVYFHKTCRALDLMFKELLRDSMIPLNLKERTLNLKEFEKLNELSFFYEISCCYQKNFNILEEKISQKNIFSHEKEIEKKILNYFYGEKDIDDFYLEIKAVFVEYDEESAKNKLEILKRIFDANELANKVLGRRLYELVIDKAFTLTKEMIETLIEADKSFDPQDFAKNAANKLKEKLEQLYIEGEGDECPKLYIDTPYEIKMSPLKELTGSRIYIYDEADRRIKEYHEIERERNFKTWDLASFNIYRIYTASSSGKEKLQSYVESVIEGRRSVPDTSY